jgi:TetR/AcrR family transcriptional regulator, transcriptional repressor for nem operon
MPILEGTKIRALREAKNLLQTLGFNGFSFQQIADRIGIKKPSLYDHFKSKEELGISLIEEYHESFVKWIETISVFEPRDKVGALFEFRNVLPVVRNDF